MLSRKFAQSVLFAAGLAAGPMATAQPVPGGDVVFAGTRDISGLDPVEAVQTDTIYVLDHIFETLFATAPDGRSVEPWLAESYAASDDGLTWTVTLREGVTFSNGQPMTSADVKWSIERTIADSPFGFVLSVIDTIETPDDRTVVFNNKTPWAPFLAGLSVWAAGIMPADFAGMTKEAFFENPIGTGPFMFGEWAPGQSVTLVKNPAYWQEGKPYLDSVTWTTVPDDNTRVLQLQGGQADIISNIPLNLLPTLDADPGLTATTFPATTVFWLSFNTTKPPFDNVHVRRAIAYAIDTEEIAAASLFGFGGRACSVISPAVPFFDPATPCLERDGAQVMAELEAAGMPGGFEVELLVPAIAPGRTIAEIIQGQAAEFGIEVTLRPIDEGQMYSTVSAYDYEMAYTGWTMDIPDPDQNISFMFDFENGGGESYSTGYDNPEAAALVRAAQQELDPTARAAIYSQIQALNAEEVPFIPLVTLNEPFAWREGVNDLFINPVGKRRMENVWLAQ